MVQYNGERERNTRNINLSDSDLARLLVQSQPGNVTGNPSIAQLYTQGQPGNVTGGRAGVPGILGMLSSSSPQDALAKQRQMERDAFGLAPANAPQMPGSSSGIQAILGQLQKLMSGQGQAGQFSPTSLPTFDPNRYKDQAEQSVNAQYDPIIQQILAGQAQTSKRARQNRVSLRDMYGGAINDINAGAAQTQKQYDATQAQSQQLYTDERNRIAAGYAADAAAQRAEAKRLGIENLGLGTEAAIQQQTADKQFADQMGSQQMQSSQAALGMQEQGAADYDKAMAQATRSDSIDAQNNIMNQLEQYLSQSNTDLANTRAQEAGATTDLAYKLAQAGYDRDAANTQFQYQQQRDYIGDQQSLAKQQADLLIAQLQAAQAGGDGSGTSADKLNPWQQVALFSDQIAPGQGSDIVAAIQAAMNGRPEIYARSNQDPVAMNPALFAKLIADYPQNSSLDRNKLMQAAQELYLLLYGK